MIFYENSAGNIVSQSKSINTNDTILKLANLVQWKAKVQMMKINIYVSRDLGKKQSLILLNINIWK